MAEFHLQVRHVAQPNPRSFTLPLPVLPSYPPRNAPRAPHLSPPTCATMPSAQPTASFLPRPAPTEPSTASENEFSGLVVGSVLQA